MGDRGGFDIAFDQVNAALQAYSDEEAAIDPALAFIVEADRYRVVRQTPGAYVYTYLANINPAAGRSASYAHWQYDAEYWLDMIVESLGDDSGVDYRRADQVAGERLRYLEQQVLSALLRPESADLGLPAGTFGGRPMMRIDPFPPEMQPGERPVIGARATLTLHMDWKPSLLDGPALEAIAVDAGRFTALYQP